MSHELIGIVMSESRLGVELIRLTSYKNLMSFELNRINFYEKESELNQIKYFDETENYEYLCHRIQMNVCSNRSTSAQHELCFEFVQIYEILSRELNRVKFLRVYPVKL